MKDIELGTWKTEFITDKVAWNQGFGAGRFWDGSGSETLPGTISIKSAVCWHAAIAY